MTALSPAFKVVDQTAGLNLNHRKCYWVQYGSESCQSSLEWVATNCEEIREMKIVKYVKYVGTMIGPEGNLHRWTAPRGQIAQHAAGKKSRAIGLVNECPGYVQVATYLRASKGDSLQKRQRIGR